MQRLTKRLHGDSLEQSKKPSELVLLLCVVLPLDGLLSSFLFLSSFFFSSFRFFTLPLLNLSVTLYALGFVRNPSAATCNRECPDDCLLSHPVIRVCLAAVTKIYYLAHFLTIKLPLKHL